MKKILLLLFLFSLSEASFSDSSDYQTRGNLSNGSVESIGNYPSGFMGLAKAEKIHPNSYGYPISFSITVKTKNVQGVAKLWYRLDDKHGGLIKLQHGVPIKGNTGWKIYSLTTLNIPRNTNLIAFGVFLSGAGKVEMKNYRLN